MAAAKRGLGRGLASLIPDAALDGTGDAAARKHGLRWVPLDEIRPNPEQPRQVFDRAELDGLVASIKTHGVLTPLVVRRGEGHYVLIAGERRLRAAGRAGLSEVPVVLREAPEAAEQLELALVENLQRSDLEPLEAALGYRRLVEAHGLTQAEVARRVGKRRTTITNALRLLKLPEIGLAALREGRIDAGHARALLPLADRERELGRLIARIEADGLSVRAVEAAVARRVEGPGSKPKSNKNNKALNYATEVLVKSLHTSVAIRPLKKGGGRIVIDYADREELDRLVEQLRGGG